MKPRVGLTLFTSSPMIFLTMVVFPALSRPLPSQSSALVHYSRAGAYNMRILISLSFSLALRKIDNMSQCLDLWLWKEILHRPQEPSLELAMSSHVTSYLPTSEAFLNLWSSEANHRGRNAHNKYIYDQHGMLCFVVLVLKSELHKFDQPAAGHRLCFRSSTPSIQMPWDFNQYKLWKNPLNCTQSSVFPNSRESS